MKKVSEKIALAVQVSMSLIFVLTTILYLTGTVSQYRADVLYNQYGQVVAREQNGVVLAAVLILAAIQLALSAYVLYCAFSERASVKRLLMFCDSDSATRVSLRVIRNVVRGCDACVDGIVVRRVRVRPDDKGGFCAVITVRANTENIAYAINKMRCLLEESFRTTLKLTFNTINFEIEKLNGRYVPNTQNAQKTLQTLQENQQETAQNYDCPLQDTSADSDPPQPAPVKKQKAASARKQ